MAGVTVQRATDIFEWWRLSREEAVERARKALGSDQPQEHQERILGLLYESGRYAGHKAEENAADEATQVRDLGGAERRRLLRGAAPWRARAHRASAARRHRARDLAAHEGRLLMTARDPAIERLAVTNPRAATFLAGLREAVPDDVKYMRVIGLFHGYVEERAENDRYHRVAWVTFGALLATGLGVLVKVFA